MVLLRTKKMQHANMLEAMISVKRCARCEEELSRVTKDLPRLKHTNEESVATNGVGTDDYLTDKDAELKFVGDVVVKPNNKESQNRLVH